MASSSNGSAQERSPRPSQDSLTSVSTTSIVFDRIHEETEEGYVLRRTKETRGQGDLLDQDPLDDGDDSETGAFLASSFAGPKPKPMGRSLRRLLIILAAAFVGVWVVALLVFVSSGSYKHASELEHDPEATSRGSAKPIAIDQLFDGTWSARTRPLEWIAGPDGEDGLLLEKGAEGKDYLVVEDVRTTVGNHSDSAPVAASRTLMKAATFAYAGQEYRAAGTWPSPDLQTVLIAVDVKRVWRHSFTAVYFVLDVATQTAQPLVPTDALARVQLATWSPQSDAIAYTRDNNLFLRRLGGAEVVQVTRDGGPEYFYGIPDWVYEEEVWAARSATWWSDDGKYLAFVATNETGVAEYTLQHFLSRPSLTEPAAGEESYPELRRIKYPKAGSHNPVVEVRFYDVARGDSFAVPLEDDFADDDRIINDLLWAGDKVLLKTTNRVSDVLKVMLIDVAARQGRTVRTTDVGQLDGGWFEISHAAKYVPADPARGRPFAGYVDQVIHEGFEHLAYFSPLDAQTPTMLTSGAWEVDTGPSAVDPSTNTVYFVAARESSTTRHVYSVSLLGGSEPVALTDTSSDAYFSVSFSAAAGYALLHYEGPKVPWQRVVSTPRNPTRYEASVEDNAELAALARTHAMPLKRYGTITLPSDTSAGSITLNYLELRPGHFSPNKKHPVLYYQYSGPGSQTVTKKFAVDFQSYVASTLGYIVIIVDPRGTGFLGRPHRVAVRSRLGQLEAHDHIAAARHFAKLHYIDGSRFCIWGWSYGGFQALKTLEVDAGETFAYGMAVAPVTDWRFYDSIYSERYMLTPQQNPAGYEAAAVTNASALAGVKRFMVMHGVADDNVHVQNSLTLFDHLDAARVENYDVHVFADSDHSIMFHDANRVVFDKLSNWLVNAFNGEWLKTEHARPIDGRR